jgi:long-subunit acyl-CoA synthetase (AMP-forming)
MHDAVAERDVEDQHGLLRRLTSPTLAQMALLTIADRGDRVAVKSDDHRSILTYRNLLDEAEKLAAGLAGLGVSRGDTVALMMTNRPEFFPIDLAALLSGAVPFSLYNSAPPAQLAYVLADARARVVLCERQFQDVLGVACREAGTVEHMVVIDGDGSGGTLTTGMLKASAKRGFDLAAAAQNVAPNDIATLIYTSGSTGAPKGVELTHANLVAEVQAIHRAVHQVPDGSYLSFLPAAHIGDRARAYYGSIIAFGHEVTTIADASNLASAMKTERPVYCGGPPRIWEKVRAGLEARYGTDLAARAALDPGLGEEIRWGLGLDRARWISTGAAPTQPGQFVFFDALGIRLCELWGMTETCSIATTNTPDAYRFGSVGRAVHGLELRLADDGELLARGPTIATGYRNRPDAMAEAFGNDGWFRTGDVARVDDDGFWWILGRKKEIMINAAGKNMSPANIEGALKAAGSVVKEACVIGDRRPYNVALIVPAVLDPSDPAIPEQVAEAIKLANRQLSRVEQIKAFALVWEEWLPGSDLMTPTMKLRRSEVEKRYAAEIERLYTGAKES